MNWSLETEDKQSGASQTGGRVFPERKGDAFSLRGGGSHLTAVFTYLQKFIFDFFISTILCLMASLFNMGSLFFIVVTASLTHGKTIIIMKIIISVISSVISVNIIIRFLLIVFLLILILLLLLME